MQLSFIPAFPLAFFILLAFLGAKLPARISAWLGVLGIGLSFAAASLKIADAFWLTESFKAVKEIAWTWIPFYFSESDSATVQMAFYLDSLSAVMLLVVSFISMLIAIFSVSFMAKDREVSWFFACMNLFVSMMLVLVLADNLLVLFLGWEGVGLASFLLIGFWREDTQNGLAATKAFLVTRIGDVFLLFAIFLLFSAFGTLNIQEILELASSNWTKGSLIATLTAFCLLFGAAGKSAQLPLQIWLSDAMRGPTPVSALIHAATMVTAGVYLIARMGGIFALAPTAQATLLCLGAATLVIAGICALLQNDIKRILAYSTMSQLGYMFLALGAGAYSAAVFHLATHACFKALLFLGAGVIGHLMHHEYSLLKIGNLRTKVPFLFALFVVGLASLAALPIVTSGFHSKEMILSEVFVSSSGGLLPWAVGAIGALITGMYSARLFALVFYKPALKPVTLESTHIDFKMKFPLLILMLLSLGAGFFPIKTIVDHSVLSLPAGSGTHVLWPEIAATVLGLVGLLIGYLKVYPVPEKVGFWGSNFGFDALYRLLITKPYSTLSHFMRSDPIRAVYRLAATLLSGFTHICSLAQTGSLLSYVFALALAAVILLGVTVSL